MTFRLNLSLLIPRLTAIQSGYKSTLGERFLSQTNVGLEEVAKKQSLSVQEDLDGFIIYKSKLQI